MLKKNWKLLEAAGLLLILSAWVVDLHNVGRHTNALVDFRKSIESVQNVHTQVGRDVLIRFEAAISRIWPKKRGAQQYDPEAYKAAWKSPEVRWLWLRTVLNEMHHLTDIMRTVRIYQDLYDLPPLRSSDRAERAIKAALDDLRSALRHKTMPTSAFVPDPSIVTSADAVNISRKVSHLFRKTTPSINDTSDALADRKSLWSNVYFWIFAIGSGLLVFGKGCDWSFHRMH